MRALRTAPYLLAACASVVSCKWTTFDDLADTATAHGESKPDISSTTWGLALAPLPVNNSGTIAGEVAVLGDDGASIVTLIYDSAGNARVGPKQNILGTTNFGHVSGDNPFVASPDSAALALVVQTPMQNGTTIAAGDPDSGSGLLVPMISGPVPGPAIWLAASDIGSDGSDASHVHTQLLLATSGGFQANADNLAGGGAIQCSAEDAGSNVLMPVALGVSDTTLLVWTATGDILSYPTSKVVGACGGADTATPLPNVIQTGLQPGPRSKLFPIPGTSSVIAVSIPTSGDASATGVIEVYDLDAGSGAGPTSQPIMLAGVRSAAFGTLGTTGDLYLALGLPSAAVDDVAAGQVAIFKVADANVDASSKITLESAQPDGSQLFGQAVAMVPFHTSAGSASMLVVGASNEVYSYYAINSLYSDLRQPAM